MLYNRDLSWLTFNFRVLQEAANSNVPLFERIKFLSIFSSNLDEFFRVRYPSVFAISHLSAKTKIKAAGIFSEELAQQMQMEISRQLEFFGSTLTGSILPALKDNGIHFYYKEPIRPEHLPEIRSIFLSEVLSFIQPIFLDPPGRTHFFPENNRLYFVITLRDAGSTLFNQAIVNIPSDKLKRFFELTAIDGTEYVIFIDDIIRENLSCIFPGKEIQGVYSIKFNRDAELKFEEDYNENLVNTIEKQLRKRDLGPPSRFLYEQTMPGNMQLYLASIFQLKFEEMFAGGRYHHLSDLASFPTYNKGLKYTSRKALVLPNIVACGDIFNVLHERDILLHLPYMSYNPVLSFFNQSAVDADVKEIYITLYRVAADSHIVNALISAARNGKKVTVFVELKARFDEANNVKWSRVMQDAGIRLIYSIPHIKVHSKIALVRKSSKRLEASYAVLSTGNFNEVTARFYTDHVLMTTDKVVIKEMLSLFKYLQKEDRGLNEKLNFEKLLVSQFNMVSAFEQLINSEIEKAEDGEYALIRVKLNNLEDPHMINQLYKASRAGVDIRLLVRGICCLVPGVDGISERITVRRIVDRYLEHTRLFIFGADQPAVIMGSSDWMIRNLHHRIEVCVPVTSPIPQKELITYFDLQWNDNDKAVQLTPAHQQLPVTSNGEKMNAQQAIYNYLQQRL